MRLHSLFNTLTAIAISATTTALLTQPCWAAQPVTAALNNNDQRIEQINEAKPYKHPRDPLYLELEIERRLYRLEKQPKEMQPH